MLNIKRNTIRSIKQVKTRSLKVVVPICIGYQVNKPHCQQTSPSKSRSFHTTTFTYQPIDQSNTQSTMTTPTIIVHHLENSRSQRILWLLEELGTPYQIKHYKRTEQGLAPKDLYDVHPLGKSPVITVDDGTKKRTIAESGAIVDYLINKFGREKGFIPTDEDEQMEVTYFNHFAEGSMMPPLVMTKVFTAIKTNSPFLIKPIAGAISGKIHDMFINPTLKAAFDFVENKMANRQFVAGTTNLTSADFMMIFPLEAAAAGRSPFVGTATRQYVERMHARPAYKAALEKGGKYDYA